MTNKVLFIGSFILLFAVSTSNARAQLVINLQSPLPTTPAATASATATPTEEPSATPVATVQPTLAPSPSATPVTTAVPTSTPNASLIPTTIPTPASATSVPAVGGVNTPASTVSPSPEASPSQAPKITVETILKGNTKQSKPIMKDIGDNAYNTLLDSPLAFLINDNNRTYYHPHGLSSSSTKLLLLSGLLLSALGILLIKSERIKNFITWRKDQASATI